MSTFSSLFQSGTAFYGDPFGPIIDTVTDWGWSLLPQFPGYIRPSKSSGSAPRSQPAETVVVAPIPVEEQYGGWGLEAETTWVRPVLPGRVGARPPEVRREIVVVGDVATEVERHPEGDYPAGSIFAPGATWGVEPHDLDTGEKIDMAVDWGGILDWGLDTLAGQQPWQTFGGGGQNTTMAFAPPNISAPSGVPGRPSTVQHGYQAMANGTGDTCGNRRYVTLDRETGKISCKRRRRRRLLTNRDLADLASLKTITGGGAALNAAVIRAVR